MTRHIKFHGTREQLMDKLLLLGIDGEWQEEPNKVWKFRCPDRSGMHWSESKGTIWFDGPQAAKSALQAKIEAAFEEGR